MRSWWSRWLRDERGGITMLFTVSAPAIILVAIGATELSSLSRDRNAIQEAADAASLMGATQLTVSSADAVIARTTIYTTSQLADVAKRMDVKVTTSVSADPAQVTVEAVGHRDSFFGNLLPPGGFTVHVSSVAGAMGSAPLCVLTHAMDKNMLKALQITSALSANGAGIELQDQSKVEASACMVQSNDDLDAKGNSTLHAAIARAVGIAKGGISPSGQSGATPIPDPFAQLPIDIPSTCPSKAVPNVKLTGTETLGAGVHCGGIEIDNDAVLRLAPGEHYFVGDLIMRNDSQLVGTDVVLVFDKASKFDFKDNSRISLQGRQQGAMAGFVVVTTRDNLSDFHMDSGRVEQLLGTLYIPSAKLVVEGTNKVAQGSAWTVIIAKQMQLHGQPILVINANYATSNVPVPAGVGPNANQSRLIR